MSKIITVIMVTVVAVLCLGAAEVNALIFNDGGVHTIDYQLDDNVWVEDSPLDELTTLNIVDDGIIRDWVNVFDYSQVNMLGGSIGYDLLTWDNSQAVISGGLIASELYAFGESYVEISGGVIVDELNVRDNSLLEIYGSNFAVDGIPVGYGPITEGTVNELDMLTGTLTGTLVSSDLLNNAFNIDPGATIILVPEPTMLLLVGLGALCFRRRTRM
jgi:hypothetical protein